MSLVQRVKDLEFAGLQGFGLLAAGTAGLFTVYVIAQVIYNTFLHPLRRFPGPPLWTKFYFPYVYSVYSGNIARDTTKLHQKYGDIVRISPSQLSFSSGDTTWPDIYNFHSMSADGKRGYKASWLKDMTWYAPSPNGVPSLLIANEADHSRERRILAHAFSDKAIKEQEPLVTQYIDQLIKQLRTRSAKGEKVDMVQWFDFVTFDVISDLMFGEPFRAVENGGHPYIKLIFEGIRVLTMQMVFRSYPFLLPFVFVFIPPSLLQKFKGFVKWTDDSVAKRLDSKDAGKRPDFIGFMLREHGNVKKDIDMSKQEMDSTAGLLMQAGSETTSTMMAGTTYALSQNPKVREKLVKELRGKFKSSDAINADELARLPYLNAVIHESLRYFPPVPTGFPRAVGQGGGTVNGHYVPEGTSVYVSQLCANQSPTNFLEPLTFAPERWLDDPKFANDKRGIAQPFSYGPRNCLGKNLAYMEMRLLLAKFVWNFDVVLQPESEGWFERCNCYALWEKPKLVVELKEAH